ncbi:MAG: DUF4349 domain-containing protein [Clostridiales bacterium]|nr:DUF4349 domain-containing protein [Clostridiales bacterium]
MDKLNENEVLRDALSRLNEDVPPMPEGLHAAWMQKVEDDMKENRTEKTPSRRSITRFLSVAAALVFVVGGTLLTKDSLNMAASRKDSAPPHDAQPFVGAAYANDYESGMASYTMDEEYDTAEATLMTAKRGAGLNEDSTALTLPTDKKIIRTARMTIVTQGFEDSLNALKDACEAQGGWIESLSESTNSYSGLRNADLTLRIPQDMLDTFLAGTDSLGRVTSRSESAQDVTASYQDIRTRLDTQLALMDRLQALITTSADLSDLLALESQIAQTQYEIDSLQSSLNSTDRQVAYSTVSVSLREERTVELTDTSVSFWERLTSAMQLGLEGLVEFLGDAVVFLVAALPFIAIVAIVVIIIKVIKRRKSK